MIRPRAVIGMGPNLRGSRHDDTRQIMADAQSDLV